MFPVREDLLVDLGAAFARSFTYIGPDGTSPDLSTWTATLAFKRYPDSKTPFLTMASGSGITLGANGSIALDLTAAQTAALDLPRFMDWGQFPGEGTMASPHDGNIAGRLAAWELRLAKADGTGSFIPMSGITCFREGTTTPARVPTTPSYAIFVEPDVSTVSWNSNGYQIDSPLILNVTIVRKNGHTAPINVSLPEMEGPWAGWMAIVNEVALTQIMAGNVPYIVNTAPDTFQMVFYGTQAGWSIQNWQGGVQLIGDDGSGTLVRSNVFSVVA
jgi:hypothetical protein